MRAQKGGAIGGEGEELKFGLLEALWKL